METEMQIKHEKKSFPTNAVMKSISNFSIRNHGIDQQHVGQQTERRSAKMRVLFSGYGKAERDMGLAPIPALRPFELRMPYN